MFNSFIENVNWGIGVDETEVKGIEKEDVGWATKVKETEFEVVKDEGWEQRKAGHS